MASRTFDLTVDHTKVSGSLTDFPVFVDLTDIDANMSAADAASIRVYSGSTELAREIVSTTEMHFLAPSLSAAADTVFRVVVDGTSNDYAAGDTHGSRAVWADYAAVWHLDDATRQAVDSAGGYNLTTTGTVTAVAGALGDAASYATGSKMLGGTIKSGDPLMLAAKASTVSMWFKADDYRGDEYGRLVDKSTGALGVNGYSYWYNSGAGGTIQGRISSSSGTFDTSVLPDGWNLLVFVLNANAAMLMYRNGTFDRMSAGLKLADDAPAALALGNWPSATGRSIAGALMDEVRIQPRPLTADWIATEYANQHSPSSFYTASERTPPPPTTRDLALAYTTGTDRWQGATHADRWLATLGADRWSARTTPEA